MKKMFYLLMSVLLVILSVTFVTTQTTDEVIGLVQQAKAAIETNAFQTLTKINKGDHPYKNIDNPALYVFILDTDLNLEAHFQTDIVGRNQKGKPDAKGKIFHDEILAKALKDGSGWIDYYFENPKTKELAHKNTYFELVKGSNGKDYIVCSGKYYDE